jgi:hypothetical protein
MEDAEMKNKIAYFSKISFASKAMPLSIYLGEMLRPSSMQHGSAGLFHREPRFSTKSASGAPAAPKKSNSRHPGH